MVALIIIGIVLGLLGIVMFSTYVKKIWRKDEFKDWMVGDMLILTRSSVEYRDLKESGQTLAKVVGWNENDLYIKIGKVTYKSSWDCFESNKSALWRRNYNECKSVMGVDPGFSSDVADTKTISSKTFNGVSIELMNEIQCYAYLKQALDTEDYEAADLIRKRMENFR
jgi:hypothetical protein